MIAVEYGRFQDPVATYVITSSSMPDTVRVYAGEPNEAEMVCTISNLSVRPLASWNAKWYSNLPGWKQRFVSEAVDIYRRYRVSYGYPEYQPTARFRIREGLAAM